jgi:hypothetical protein
MIEWMCTHWNPEVAIIFGAAARYRRATVDSSHDDAHPDNATLHTGAVRPHTGFVGSLFFISFRTGHGSSKVFEMLPAFSCKCSKCCHGSTSGDHHFCKTVTLCRPPSCRVDRNLALYLPRLTVLVSIEADRPGA